MSALDLDLSFLNPGSYFSSMPAETVQVLGQMRIGKAITIIVAAIVVKTTLQLIPFTRLGS
ncbi:MAG: DUF2523 domain-containing protein [Candidatus Polarisedimenticolaceae bacterium]|nr:DUF2523 domain-containing protein [Candidatus Polarisedimenticolaceae bacterium]